MNIYSALIGSDVVETPTFTLFSMVISSVTEISAFYISSVTTFSVPETSNCVNFN